jgi:hypothetical protein
MRNFIKYKVIGLAFIVTGMVACDQASQDTAPIGSPDGYPVSTVTPAATSVIEGNSLIINITIDKMIERAITFTFKQTGGTANEEDYTVEAATLEPYSKSVQMVINALMDYDFTDETLVGEIGVYSIADRYLLNPSAENPVNVSFTIVNAVSPNLQVAFSWDKTITIGSTNYSAANYVDFDFFYADAEGFDPADPWATAIDWAAATGSHPETFEFANFPDGSYIMIANLYSNEFAGMGANTTIPVTASFTRQGTSLVDFLVEQQAADAMSSEQPGYVQDGGDFNMVICKVTVAGDKYTIYDAHDTNLGTYKKSGAAKTPRTLIYKSR